MKEWWFLSFAQPGKFLGGAYLLAGDFMDAVRLSHRLGINPGGSVAGFDVPGIPPERFRNRLLSRAECEECDAMITGKVGKA